MGISALSTVTIAGLRLPTAGESGNTGATSTSSKIYPRPGKLPYTPLFIDIKDEANDVNNAENSTPATRAMAYATTDTYDVIALHLSPTPEGLRKDRTTSDGTTTTILTPLASDFNPANVVAGRVQTTSRTTTDAGLESETVTRTTSVTETLTDVDVMTVTYNTDYFPADTGDLTESTDNDYNVGNPGIGVNGEAIALNGDHALTTTQITAVSGAVSLPAIAFAPDAHESPAVTTLLSSPSVGGTSAVSAINTPAPAPAVKDSNDELMRIRPEPKRADGKTPTASATPESPGLLEKFRMGILEKLQARQDSRLGIVGLSVRI